MRTVSLTRRNAMKWLVAGTATSLVTGCGAVGSLPRGGPVGTTDGSTLAIDVRDALRQNPSTANITVNISSNEDEVTIKGTLNSTVDRDNIEIVANQVSGVRHVIMDVYVR